jgi:putative ABC transport system ATP-binding protein
VTTNIEPVLSLRGISKSYGQLEVLHGVDLEVRAGDFVAVVGPSGSGKSTLLHVMGTLDRPTSGEVIIDGVSTSGMSDTKLAGLRSRRIGFVFQSFHLLPGTSALENTATGLIYDGVPRRKRRAAARELLTRLGLGDRVNHTPSQLSGGEQQRVAIARALMNRPSVLFADEPTGNLDSASGNSVMELLTELNDEGTTVMVITHDRDLAAKIPRQIDMLDGTIVADTRNGVHATARAAR